MKIIYYILFTINSKIFYLYFFINKTFFSISKKNNKKLKIYYSLFLNNKNNKNNKINKDDLFIKMLLINNENNILENNKDILEENIWYKIKDINKLINYEKYNSHIINYEKLKKNKNVLKNIVNIKKILITGIIILLSLILLPFQNNQQNNLIDNNIINTNIDKKENEIKSDILIESISWTIVNSLEQKSINTNIIDEEPFTKLNQENLENINSLWNLSEINSGITTQNILNKNNSTNVDQDNLEKNKNLNTNTSVKQLIEKDFINQNKSFIYYLKETILKIKDNIFQNEIIKILITSIFIFILLSIISYLLLKIFWKYIIFYWLILLIINISIFILYPKLLILNLLFLIITINWIIISIIDIITYKKLNYKEIKKIKKYFIFRNYYFIFYLTITIFLFILFLIYELDIKVFNLINNIFHLTNNNTAFIIFIDKYIIWTYVYLSFIFFILIYTNLIKIIKWVFLKHLEKDNLDYSKLIKNSIEENLIFFYKNKEKIEGFKFYLENFLFITSNSKKYIKYILNEIKIKNIKSNNFFENKKDYIYPNNFITKLLNQIKIRKYKLSGAWDYKVISYLDNGDKYSHISNINIKKSIKLNKTIINKYENDLWANHLEKVYIDMDNILEIKNLNQIKILLDRLKNNKLTIGKTYLCIDGKVIEIIHSTSYKKLLNYINILMSGKEFKWKKVIFPKFIIKKDHKFINKLEFIYNLVYNKIENNKSHKMNPIHNSKNILHI